MFRTSKNVCYFVFTFVFVWVIMITSTFQLQQKPKLFLTLDELTRHHPASNGTTQVKQLPPLFIADVQHLLLYALQVQRTVADPRYGRFFAMVKVCIFLFLYLFHPLRLGGYSDHAGVCPSTSRHIIMGSITPMPLWIF